MTLVKKIILALVGILVAISGWYYFYWMSTPIYAAKEIHTAIKTNDYDLLRSRVDLEKVYTAIIEDSTDEFSGSGSSLIKRLKKPLVKELIHQTDRYFYQKEQEHNLLDDQVNSITSSIGFATLSVTDHLSVDEINNQTVLTLTFHDKKLNRDFTWKILLEKDVNNNWCATKIINLKEYIAERKQAIKDNL